MEKIDRRRHYIMMTDTETANTIMGANGKLDMSSVLVYDIGWQVIDKQGNVYAERSYIIDDIFNGERELMKSAYYAKKIPQYLADIASGKRIVVSLYEARRQFIADMEMFGTKTVSAHNARFDYNALNGTQRYITKSKYRYFFPYGVEIWDTLKMARDVILPMPTYRRFCADHGYMTKNGQCRLTAEIIYRFISGNHEFDESHTGLEDVDIERQILVYCFRKHKRMRKALWA